MNTKIKIAALLGALGFFWTAVAFAAPAHKARHHKKAETVTILDLSGPSGPESAFPTISKKGPL